MAHDIHDVPGRLCVRSAHVNSMTGSILVDCDGARL
jgi:hypothetical protein